MGSQTHQPARAKHNKHEIGNRWLERTLHLAPRCRSVQIEAFCASSLGLELTNKEQPMAEAKFSVRNILKALEPRTDNGVRTEAIEGIIELDGDENDVIAGGTVCECNLSNAY